MKKLSKFLSVSNVFLLSLGAMIGVGFLSGAEIWSFFARFGSYFFISIFVLFWLLYFVINSIFKMTDKNENNIKLQNFNKIKQKSTFLIKYKLKNFLILFNIFVIASAMVSGLKNIIFEVFETNEFWIFIGLILLIFILLNKGFSALSRFNFLMILSIMVIIIYLIIIGGFDFDNSLTKLLSTNNHSLGELFGSIIYAGIYVFFNTSQVVPIIENLDEKLTKKERRLYQAIFSGCFSLIVCFLVLFLTQNSHLVSSSMPLLEFFKCKSGVIKYFFIGVLIMALLSTLLVCLNGMKKQFEKGLNFNILSSFLAVISALIFGFLPFNFFINFAYPLVGVISFVCFIFL